MTIIKIGKKGKITIPSEIRKKYGLKDGDKVLIIDHPLEGIKILPHLYEEKLHTILDLKTGIKIIEEISEERRREVEKCKKNIFPS
ncbi:MAG: AbrB/MazE/SpoVT family DNA-binding domain-containing protein [Promethearchaeota archaeon]